MKQLFFLLAGFFFSSLCAAQDFQKDFQTYFQDKDTVKQKEVLVKWQNSNPRDPEMFICYFNYYFSRALQETLVLTTEQPEGEALVLADSLNQTVGYVESKQTFIKELVQEGIDKINVGIALYPDRLDMRFGKVYVYGRLKKWDDFTEEILRAIRYSGVNNNQWKWENNAPINDGKDALLSSLQTYQLNLYNTNDDALLQDMRKIAEEVLKLYPDHIESLSNVAITCFINKDFDTGLEALLKAERINPQDTVVLGNIAYGYKMKGDKKTAISYYEKLLKYVDEKEKEGVRKEMEELK